MSKFNCIYCGKSCKNIQNLYYHQSICKSNPNRTLIKQTYVECKFCKKLIQCQNIKKHEQSHIDNPKKFEKIVYYDMHDGNKCLFCGRELKNKNALALHERCCKNNPDKVSVSFRHSGRASTAEKELLRKEKISSSMKKNKNAGGLRPNSGRGKKGKYKGYKCDLTYELVWIIYNLDHNVKFERCNMYYEYEHGGSLHKYFPDFILEDGSLVEIKGYMTDLVQIKLNSVTDRKIKLLLFNDLKYAFDYVKENYQYKTLADLYDKQGAL